MLTDKAYRKKVVANVTDTSVKAYWEQEFANYTERFAAEATPAIQNKIGQFTSNPLIRNIVGQPKSSFNIREMMDERKIVIINLSKGLVGEQNANIIGSMLITKVYLAAMSRADVSTATIETLPNFYLYVDEFQSFANESFANILSEARKYKLNLTIAHQYIEQMSEEVRAAVFGNVGTMISFRVGALDAEILEREFAPEFTAEDLVNLGFAQIYLKLMIDGIGSHPFSAVTIPPIINEEGSHKEEIIELSRKSFAFPRAEVEEKIKSWHDEGSAQQKKGSSKPKTVRESLKLGDKKDSKGGPKKENKKNDTHKPFVGLADSVRSVSSGAVNNSDSTQSAKAAGVSNAKAEESRDSKKNNNKSNDGLVGSAGQTKKGGKNPSKENVNELKNALAGILQDVKKKEKENSKITKDIKKDISDIKENQKGAGLEPQQKSKGQDEAGNSGGGPDSENDSDEKKHTETTSKHTSVHIKKTVHENIEKKPEQKEVPEDVLRKILDTSNEA